MPASAPGADHRSLHSRTGVSVPYCAVISSGCGSAWCFQARYSRHCRSRTDRPTRSASGQPLPQILKGKPPVANLPLGQGQASRRRSTGQSSAALSTASIPGTMPSAAVGRGEADLVRRGPRVDGTSADRPCRPSARARTPTLLRAACL